MALYLLNKRFSVKSTQYKSLKAYKKLYAASLWTAAPQLPEALESKEVDGGRGAHSLVPSLFYCTWKKTLVKRVFNFVSVRQDLDVANQIAEQCLRHGHAWKKIAIVTWRSQERADRHSFSKLSMKLPIVRVWLSVLEVWARRKARLCLHDYNASANSAIVRTSQNVTYIQWEPKLNTCFTTLFFHMW